MKILLYLVFATHWLFRYVNKNFTVLMRVLGKADDVTAIANMNDYGSNVNAIVTRQR
jgi:hypothetical protein